MQAKKFESKVGGVERVQQYRHHVSEALAKLLRKSSSHLNVRDEAALKDLLDNFQLYILNDITILDRVNRVFRQQKAENAAFEEFEELNL